MKSRDQNSGKLCNLATTAIIQDLNNLKYMIKVPEIMNIKALLFSA